MLKPSALKSLLSQANSGGVHSTLLLNREGSLVSYSGVSDNEARVNSAIAASIWAAYEKSAKVAVTPSSQFGVHESESFHSASPLQFVVIDCEQGLAALAGIPGSDFVVFSLADHNCELGMIKKKVMALSEALKDAFVKA